MSAPLALLLGIAMGAVIAGVVVGIQMRREVAKRDLTIDILERVHDDAFRRHVGDPHNYGEPASNVNKAKWRRGEMKNVHDPESS